MDGHAPEPIAVVGASCRLPGAPGLREFWEGLSGEREAVTALADGDLLRAGVSPEELADPSYVRAAALMPDAAGFDAAFFGMTAGEARRCDPQARVFAELAHSALESAGLDVSAVGERTGVFAACGTGRYRDLHLRDDSPGPDPAASVAALLGLTGPCVGISTGSLAAVHLACEALRSGDCDIAVAGGGHIRMPYGHGYRWAPGSRYAPDGRCRPFDARAAGTVPGSGAGVVVLRRLSEAILDGSRILGVVRGGATSHDPAGPSRCIAEALDAAAVDADAIGYVEAHGSGVPAEDLAELAALGEVMEGPVRLGSVKSAVGDLASAAGAAGLLKVLLSLERGRIPATVNARTPHPAIRSGPFDIVGESRAWPRADGTSRQALVCDRATGDVHACLVVAEGPPAPAPLPDRRPRLVVWSGHDARAADEVRAGLARHFAGGAGDFEDAVATLQQGRATRSHRGAAVCSDAAEAAAALAGEAQATEAGAPRVAFAFPGAFAGPLPQGLYGTERTFTETADVLLERFEDEGLDIYDLWTSGEMPEDGPEARALLFTFEYALARMWQAWGVQPHALVGHGVGEVVADVVRGTRELGSVMATDLPDLITPSVGDHMREVRATGAEVVLEAGPGDALTRLFPDDGPVTALASFRADGRGGTRPVLETLGRLWTMGRPVDWAALDSDRPPRRVPLPAYPYRRERHWAVPGSGPAAPKTGTAPARETAMDPEITQVPGLPAPAEPLRPLSRTQHAFWMLERLAPGTGVSNIGIAFRTARPLRWYPLQTAVERLVARQPALRLRFPEVDGVPLRHLTGPGDARIEVPTDTTTEETLIGDLQAFLDEPFDLGRDPLFRAGHFVLPDGASVVCLAAHHIVIDAPAVQLLVEEIGRLYDAVAEGRAVPEDLAGPAPLLAEPEPDPASLRYWTDRLRGAEPEAMVLPGTRLAPRRPTFAGHTCSWEMAASARDALERLRGRLQVTDNIILMSAFALMLLRHGAGPDLVIGIPVTTRRPATRRSVGYGVSTLPLRVRPDPGAGFADLVRQVAEAFFEGVEHADVSVETVITERGHGTGDWRVPLFRHMFNYRPWTDERIAITGEVPGYIEDLFDRSRLDLQCVAVPEPGRFTLRAWHSTEVHDEAEIASYIARMQVLLEEAAEDAGRPVAELGLASAGDRAVLDALNGTERTWDGPGTLAQRIARRAAESPDAAAVVDGDDTVTYARLVAQAVAVRDLLREHGTEPGDVVALALGRSAAMAAAVLGVWAAGAAYLPLDARQPEMRLSYQVEDAGARAVLVRPGESAGWAGERPVLPVPDATGPGELLDRGAPEPGAAAYVIHTSGSTGRPKGVAVSHRNLLNLVCDFAERLGCGPGEPVLWSTTTSFDISWLELFLPLLCGAPLVVAPDEAQLKPSAFLGLVERHDVAVIQATPTAWRLVAAEAAGELRGRTVLCGGEPMPAALARRLLSAGCRLFNVYGPTETTIWSTAAEITGAPEDPVPVGAPLANTRVFVLDEAGRELPPGVPGELCVAGDGVSLGYPARPDLTAERFGDHPRHGRFYRTGDQARVRHDGALELLGRADRQVKLRGHRIELGEVEAVLHEHRRVRAAAVTLAGDPQGDGRLVAYVEPDAAPGDGLAEELWRHARARLPGYAVPSGFTLLDGLPATPNGKIDYARLPAPEEAPAPAAAPSPGDPGLVERLVGLWRETLRRPGLGARDNFFLHGGHSILAVRLVSALEEIAGTEVDVRTVFEYPTPAELAAHLGERP
ncbi:non-ribosomal peptide synthetase [Actinomadura sp. 7K507]|uniref:non-ribosomal peptide synthetase n=1 Tax=Actinomadura sp. 7K507 TaxID=2530365 RepID=UPI001046C097|nr:non-ribosomal peptide synthetase [Actinomadura sp. 7K507]TDC91352.1 amino acid adenylation domain-containing protein [Actinomadura sp. 7K507]